MLSGSAHVKAVHRTLMKLSPRVNLINILLELFFVQILLQKSQSQTVIREKLSKALLYEKRACEMLM